MTLSLSTNSNRDHSSKSMDSFWKNLDQDFDDNQDSSPKPQSVSLTLTQRNDSFDFLDSLGLGSTKSNPNETKQARITSPVLLHREILNDKPDDSTSKPLFGRRVRASKTSDGQPSTPMKPYVSAVTNNDDIWSEVLGQPHIEDNKKTQNLVSVATTSSHPVDVYVPGSSTSDFREQPEIEPALDATRNSSIPILELKSNLKSDLADTSHLIASITEITDSNSGKMITKIGDMHQRMNAQLNSNFRSVEVKLDNVYDVVSDTVAAASKEYAERFSQLTDQAKLDFDNISTKFLVIDQMPTTLITAIHATSESQTSAMDQSMQKLISKLSTFENSISSSMLKSRSDTLTDERQLWTEVSNAWITQKAAFEQSWYEGRAALLLDREQLDRQKQELEAEKIAWQQLKVLQQTELDQKEDQHRLSAEQQMQESSQLETKLALDQKHWKYEKQRLQVEVSDLVKRHQNIQTEILQLENQVSSSQHDLVRLRHEANDLRTMQGSSARRDATLRQLVNATSQREIDVSQMMEEARIAREEAIKMRNEAAEAKRQVTEETAKFERYRLNQLKTRSSSVASPTASKIARMQSNRINESQKSKRVSSQVKRSPLHEVKEFVSPAMLMQDDLHQFMVDAYHNVLVPPHHRELDSTD